MQSGLASSESSGHGQIPSYRPHGITSKSEPSVLVGRGQLLTESLGAPRCLSRHQSEPIVLCSQSFIDPLKALSLTHLGRGWSLLTQHSGGLTLSKDFLHEIYKFQKPNDLCFVNICSKHLINVDKKSLKCFTNVVYVDAGDNQLPFEVFGCFPSLKELILPLNNLSYFSVQVYLFQHLKILDLSFNHLLPSSVYGLSLLPALHWLNLSSNGLDRLPSGINHKSFPVLESLILDDNRLGKTKDFIFLCRLPKLKLLSLDRNLVRSLPVIDTHVTEKRNETTVLAMLPSLNDYVFTFSKGTTTKPTTTEQRTLFSEGGRTTFTEPRTAVTTAEQQALPQASYSLTALDKISDTRGWRRTTHTRADSTAQRQKSEIPASRLLLRHLGRSHARYGTWPLPTELLNALITGSQVPPRHKTVLYDPNVSRLVKHTLPPIDSELTRLSIGEDGSDVYGKSEEIEDTSDLSVITGEMSTSTLASVVVNEVMNRLSRESSERSPNMESSVSRSRSSGKPSSRYEPAGSGARSDDSNTTSVPGTSAMSDSVVESLSVNLNVQRMATKSSVGQSMITRESAVSSFISEPHMERISKAPSSKSPVTEKSKSDRSSSKSDHSDKLEFSGKHSENSEQLIESFSRPSSSSKQKSTPSNFAEAFHPLPDVLPSIKLSTRETTTGATKPIFVCDETNLFLPFPTLQKLSLAGNKLRCMEDLLAVKTWRNVTEVSIKGNPAMSLPPLKLSLIKQQLVPEVKKKLETYKFNDKSIDPFYKKKLVSKLNPVEIRPCPCHSTETNIMTGHDFFNLDVTQPTPKGVLSLPTPNLRLCRYRKTVEESLAAYREMFRQLTFDPTMSFDTIPIIPFSLRAAVFPMHLYTDLLDRTGTSIENSTRIPTFEWPLTKTDTISSQTYRLPAGGDVYSYVNDAILRHLESHILQVEATNSKGHPLSIPSVTTTNNIIKEALQKAEQAAVAS